MQTLGDFATGGRRACEWTVTREKEKSRCDGNSEHDEAEQQRKDAEATPGDMGLAPPFQLGIRNESEQDRTVSV